MGGPGKTTICMLLAGRLAHDGLKVAALDADPAGAFSRWATRTYEGVPLFTAEAEADEARLAHLTTLEAGPPTWCWWTPPASATGQPASR
jgi:cellulose biosynthesis protein BcsQ